MSVRYIGSKARVAPQIGAILGPWDGSGRFVDALCGTGAVGRIAAETRWPVVVNDQLASSVAVAVAQLLAQSDVSFDGVGGYHAAITALNGVEDARGFIWSEYSPASASRGTERRYFTEQNAARIDSIRAHIGEWQTCRAVSFAEARLLIADLLAAANRVANIAGTYGCFLREWTANALRPLLLAPRVLREVSVPIEATCRDVFELSTEARDTVYLDPPYTKRQYAAYYHILETIAAGDSPSVGGITGLRPWEDKASPFCYKTRALDSLVSLIEGISARRILLSYSNEGHVGLDDLHTRLAALGELRVEQLATIGRYRPNGRASANGSSVSEYLLDLRLNCADTSVAPHRTQEAVA